MTHYQIPINGATSDTTQQVVIQADTVLVGIQLVLACQSSTDNDAAYLCASLDGVNPSLLGGAAALTQVLAALGARTRGATAAGFLVHSESIFVPQNEVLRVGQSLYLHLDVSSANITCNCFGFFHCK